MSRLLARLAQGLTLLVVLSMLVFVFAELAPGDFFTESTLDPRMSEELIETLRGRYGLEQPLHVRYARWVVSVARGEGGFSIAYRRPVADLFLPRALNTLVLTGSSLLIAWMAALILGIVSAYRAGGWLDRSTLVGVAVLLAVPELLLALLGVLVGVNTRLPLGGATSFDYDSLSGWARLVDRIEHLIIPVSVLVLTSLPILVRHVRSSVLEALDAPYVRAAHGHGIAGGRLMLAYVLPAAANPLITLFGVSLGGLLSGSLVIEGALGWPGLGPLLLESLTNRDLHVLLAGILGACAFLMVGNLIADALLVLTDPRSGD